MDAACEAGGIEVYVVATGWGVPFETAAPFPLKLLTWLRMVGIPHTTIVENDARKGPKKKTPWIVEDGRRMGDSEIIIGHLQRTRGVDLDARLDAFDRAVALAWQRTFEEHYHQALEHQLFLGRGGRGRLREMMQSLPPIARDAVPLLFRSALAKQLYARGLGRHDEAEIIAMGKADLDAASAFLGDKPYFLGDDPATVDATAFGFLATSIYVEGDNPLFCHAASLPNLVAFCERVRARYFPETLSTRS